MTTATVNTSEVFLAFVADTFRDDDGNPVAAYPEIPGDYADEPLFVIRAIASPTPYPLWNVLDRFYVMTYGPDKQTILRLHDRMYSLCIDPRTGQRAINRKVRGLNVKTIGYEQRPALQRDENNRLMAIGTMFLKIDIRQTWEG